MSHLNNIKNEKEKILGDIAINESARSLIHLLRVFNNPLIDCKRIAQKMIILCENDPDFIGEEVLDEDYSPEV